MLEHKKHLSSLPSQIYQFNISKHRGTIIPIFQASKIRKNNLFIIRLQIRGEYTYTRSNKHFQLRIFNNISLKQKKYEIIAKIFLI